MPFKHDDTVRDYVRFRYVVKGETPEEIADADGDLPSSRTIRTWAKEEGWDDQRDLKKTSRWAIALRLRKMVDRKLLSYEEKDELPPSSELDGIHKALKSADMLDSSIERASNSIEALDAFNSWLLERDPALADQLASHMGLYARELVEDAT